MPRSPACLSSYKYDVKDWAVPTDLDLANKRLMITVHNGRNLEAKNHGGKHLAAQRIASWV